MSDHDDQKLLRKIQVLLDAPHHYDEFLLIVLVLLTRVSEKKKVEQIWKSHSDTLNAYCCRLENKPSYLHILARLLSRFNEKEEIFSSDVFQVLYNALLQRVKAKAPLSAFDVDLILALNVTVPEERVRNVIATVWQRFQQVIQMDVKEQVHTVTAKESSSAADWKLVHDTLEALVSTDEGDIMTSLQRAVLQTLSTHSTNTVVYTPATINSLYKPMVAWVTNDEDTKEGSEKGPSPSLIEEWHGLVLQCTRQLTLDSPKDLQQVLLHSKSLSSSLIQLMLFYISYSSSSVEMQSLAWTTLATMVDVFCFDWMMMSGSGTLGNATSLCTMLRLASGEWRIQLGRLVVDEKSESDESAMMILDSCGRVICAALHHVVHLAEERQEKFQMQASALLHVRDSLQDALHATVQYLCHARQQPRATTVAGRVLGSLLTEFNVWDGLPNGVDTDETLQALSVVLQHHEENPGALLQCLVMVLASVEGPSYCIKFLDKHHLLGKTLVDFLVSFWKNSVTMDVDEDDATSQCRAACQVAELWYNMTTPPPSVTAPLRKVIIKWIRTQLDGGSPYVEALSLAVDCFVMLFGQDAVPSEREATVVQRALETCEAQQVS